MGKLSRTKGRAFEQQIARELRAAFPAATIRRSLQAHRAYEPDLVIEGQAPERMRRLWLELTSSRAPSPLDKLAQAERDTATPRGYNSTAEMAYWPVVVWHKHATQTVYATMRNETWLQVIGVCPSAPPALPGDGVPITLDWEQLLSLLKEMPL